MDGNSMYVHTFFTYMFFIELSESCCLCYFCTKHILAWVALRPGLNRCRTGVDKTILEGKIGTYWIYCTVCTSIYRSYSNSQLLLATRIGVSSIFLRVHRSKNAIHKPTHTFGVKIVNKKYVFNYYRYFLCYHFPSKVGQFFFKCTNVGK
jgi:hypothetical protein